MDVSAEMVVGLFHLVHRCDLSQCVYEVMYEEKRKKGTPGHPPKWTHARFMEKLVYDFIFPKRSVNNTDDSANTTSICSFSSFGQGSGNANERIVSYDLNNSSGRKTYLDENPTV